MHMDIFNDDAFDAVTMTQAIEDYDFRPGLLGTLLTLDGIPTSTELVSVERRGNSLAIIKTSERGAPLEEGKRDGRNIRAFRTTRIAKGHTLNASEIQNVRAFGSESELETMIGYVGRYESKLISDVELTWENMLLGLINGAVLDADGTVIVDWYAEWGLTRPAVINFDLDNVNADPEGTCRSIIRKMQGLSKGSFLPTSRIIGLAGDSFFDKLTKHKTVREVYLNSAQAQNLNRAFGVATQSALGAGSYAVFDFAGITFINYRGTDDFDSTAKRNNTAVGTKMVGIPTTRCKFFPINVPGLFQEAFSPLESWDFANTIGRRLYAMLIRDRDRSFFVRPEVYSYPLFICTRPDMLFEGQENAAG